VAILVVLFFLGFFGMKEGFFGPGSECTDAKTQSDCSKANNSLGKDGGKCYWENKKCNYIGGR
jgi:hypothetical protein